MQANQIKCCGSACLKQHCLLLEGYRSVHLLEMLAQRLFFPILEHIGKKRLGSHLVSISLVVPKPHSTAFHRANIDVSILALLALITFRGSSI